jgi:hypothetical protein
MKGSTVIDHAKAVGDTASLAATVGVLFGWLPYAAALASLIWTCIRIYETRTVQRWLYGESPLRPYEDES